MRVERALSKRFDRAETAAAVRLSGFDIRDTAAWLESYYLDLAETQ